MPEYRIYVLSAPEKIDGPAHNIVCDTNEEAVSRAAEFLRDDNYVEIWQGARLVRRLPADKVWATQLATSFISGRGPA